MTALYFGESEQPLYGFFHPADFSTDKRIGLLICNGLAHEYLRSHRMLKQLAVQLSRQGISVMRFDYPCTGDSAGSTHQARTGDWIESITMAMEELEALSAADRFATLSIRAGALFLDRADLNGFSIHRRIAIDPVLDGAAYATALDQVQLQVLNDPMRFEVPRTEYRNPRFTEWMGNEYSAAFVAELQQLRLHPDTLQRQYSCITTTGSQTAGISGNHTTIDVDCRWQDGAALETQVVIPGLANTLLELL